MENSTTPGSDLRLLIDRYVNNTCSQEELMQIAQLAKEGSVDLMEVLQLHWENVNTKESSAISNPDELFTGILDRAKITESLTYENQEEPRISNSGGRRRFIIGIAAAAAILVAILVTAQFVFNNDDKNIVPLVQDKPGAQEVLPGGDRAILTLANGQQIVLDSANDGNLASQGGIKVIKMGGQLRYDTEGQSTEVLYNTISTPRGGQYQLELADGSKVWLNSASSLRFPTSFSGAYRKVELTGEGYFEVEEDPAKPFIVSSAPSAGSDRGVEVTVLGTLFNVNLYDDESRIKVSLLNGSVQVVNPANTPALKEKDIKTLIPGEQAELSASEPIRVNNNVDMDEVLAWKNGYFFFKDSDLQSVMRQLARWYDVEVVYEGKIPKRQFEGKMPRNSNLSEVLKIIETNNVHMKIQGKKIVVTP